MLFLLLFYSFSTPFLYLFYSFSVHEPLISLFPFVKNTGRIRELKGYSDQNHFTPATPPIPPVHHHAQRGYPRLRRSPAAPHRALSGPLQVVGAGGVRADGRRFFSGAAPSEAGAGSHRRVYRAGGSGRVTGDHSPSGGRPGRRGYLFAHAGVSDAVDRAACDL